MPHRRLIAALMVTLLVIGCLTPGYAESPVMEVHQLMLGCADGYLIRLGDDITIAIDCGKDTGSLADRAIEALHEAGCTKLTAYIATHYHDDHAGNMAEILEAFGTEDTLVYGPTEAWPEKYGTPPHNLSMAADASWGRAAVRCHHHQMRRA